VLTGANVALSWFSSLCHATSRGPAGPGPEPAPEQPPDAVVAATERRAAVSSGAQPAQGQRQPARRLVRHRPLNCISSFIALRQYFYHYISDLCLSLSREDRLFFKF
jgi:hypothetical protein